MAWRDTLQALESELSEVREERLRQTRAEEAEHQRQREQLSRLAASLGVSHLLEEMNSILLKRAGKIETFLSWESTEEGNEEESPLLLLDEDEDEEDADYISVTLGWEEDGEREIAVDVGISDDGAYLQVNGVDIRPEREALERALVEAFREELEI